jgi:hypothetical protein
MLSLSEQKFCLKRQLELVKDYQELTKELEFKDFRISKLEQEIRDLKNELLQKDKEQIQQTVRMNYKRINIYG